MKKIVCITGHAREGKTTLANKLSSYFSIETRALADPLKNMTHELFKLFEMPIPEDKEKVRPYYQRIGTEICKSILGENIWCEVLDRNIGDMCIISDIRFENEYRYFKDRYDTILIRVKNDCVKNTMTHASEAYIDKFVPDYLYNIRDGDEGVIEYVKGFLQK